MRDTVAEVGARNQLTPAQVALGWLLNKWPEAAPIVGATTVAHLEEAVATLDKQLDTEDVEALETPYQPRPRAAH